MSEFNRRDLIKFFGIGAAIVPLVAGTPEMSAPVRLVEEARFEPLDIASPSTSPYFADFRFEPNCVADHRLKVTMEYEANGHRWVFNARSFVVHTRNMNTPWPGGPRGLDMSFRQMAGCDWQINGRAIDNPSFEFHPAHPLPYYDRRR